ncbi:hypothetical protein BKA67DRAFT_688475 [Truncatella angustata]|uniref:RRM domain-containing protein n=1 Tax=Truncatella angustata TaxID=152316 RepID=A0A9P8URN8_9PEZI|nr:uncharacterized protein BKA67DRAFT_688475 [Truncatella angustata]KAH6657119.1 hypothetical protein BKA67DRAFT_688475 [Truncatella angustata]KAH8200396.1 hypothetical protein TruAng_005425 [Truncatella angustata]
MVNHYSYHEDPTVTEASAAVLRVLSPLRHRANELAFSPSTLHNNRNIFEHLPNEENLDNPDFSLQILAQALLNNIPPQLPARSPSSGLLPDITGVEPSTMAQREFSQLMTRNRSSTPTEGMIDTIYRQAFGFRPSYNGDVRNPANRPNQVPSHRNCNFWITNLPRDCTEHDLENAITNVGSIWAMYLNPPEPSSGLFSTAASLSFTRLSSARDFMNRSRWGGFIVNGRRACVGWNRNHIGPQTPDGHDAPDRSRVLIIVGPVNIVNPAMLTEFFRRYFSYRTTGIETIGQDTVGYSTMEWRFARVSGQANIAASCLRGLRDQHGIDVDYFWGTDPCEANERLN